MKKRRWSALMDLFGRDMSSEHYNPALLVCLLARDLGDTSQGHPTVDGGPEIGTGGPEHGTGGPPAWLCQLGLYQARIDPRLLRERSRAHKQTSIGLYLPVPQVIRRKNGFSSDNLVTLKIPSLTSVQPRACLGFVPGGAAKARAGPERNELVQQYSLGQSLQ
jgi:hypothetical protein